MEESSIRKHKIEMVKEYKVLPPMGEKSVEATINSHARDGWEVLVFNRVANGKYYTLMVRAKQK